MKNRALNFVFASICAFGVSQGVAQTNPQCLDKSFTLQLLGSGGPITEDASASAVRPHPRAVAQQVQAAPWRFRRSNSSGN